MVRDVRAALRRSVAATTTHANLASDAPVMTGCNGR